jgi:hypothetical protein
MSRFSHQISVQKELVLTTKETENHVSIVNIQIDQEDNNHNMLDKMSISNMEMQDKMSISSKKSDQSLSGTSFSSSLGQEDRSEGDFGPALSGQPDVLPPYTKVPESVVVIESTRSTPSPTNQKNFDGLNLNMTAKEMREMLESRKKKDPRKEKNKKNRMDFRTKTDNFQTL